MSQEYNVTPIKRPKHTSRAQRNRPVLVTGESSTAEQTAFETLPPKTLPISETAIPTSSAPKRRLPSFFSTVGKSAEAETKNGKAEIDPAQARLARATRTAKTSAITSKSTSKETPSATVKASVATTKPNTPAKPTSAFKTKHIIGIAIYLLAANFLGLFETAFLRNIHADSLLTKFNLFGNQVTIYTSTLLFLATLIVILVLLAKFDFIPRSLGPTPQQRTASKNASSNKNETVKTLPPSIRPGVKGSDDKLYETYRLNQRREKKR